jgi:hypothetical protein
LYGHRGLPERLPDRPRTVEHILQHGVVVDVGSEQQHGQRQPASFGAEFGVAGKLCRPPIPELERRVHRAVSPGERLALAGSPARATEAAAVLRTVASDPRATLDERWHAAAAA